MVRLKMWVFSRTIFFSYVKNLENSKLVRIFVL